MRAVQCAMQDPDCKIDARSSHRESTINGTNVIISRCPRDHCILFSNFACLRNQHHVSTCATASIVSTVHWSGKVVAHRSVQNTLFIILC